MSPAYSRLMGEDEEGAAHEQVRDRLDIAFDDLGEQQVKNIGRPVRVFAVRVGPRASGPHAGGTPAVQPTPLPLPDKPSLAVLPSQNMTGDAEAVAHLLVRPGTQTNPARLGQRFEPGCNVDAVAKDVRNYVANAP